MLGIADRFSVDSDDVKKWNRLKTNHVARGMVLRIYTLGGATETASSSPRARSASKKKPKPATHVVQAATPASDKN